MFFSSPLLALLAAENAQQRFACLLDGASIPTHQVIGGGAKANRYKLDEWAFLGLDVHTRLDVVNNQYYKNGVWVGSHTSTEQLFAWLEDETDAIFLESLLSCIQSQYYDDSPPSMSVPFQQGWLSFWGYETNQLLEAGQLPVTPKTTITVNPFEGLRLLWFDSIIAWHKPSETYYAFGLNMEKLYWYLAQLIAWEPPTEAELAETSFPTFSETWLEAYQPSFTPETFATAVADIQHHIEQGNLYQANLSVQWRRDYFHTNPLEMFELLCRVNPSPFAGLLKTPQGWVLSNSPERLVRCNAAAILETRPIAGTRGRGATPEEDDAIVQTLITDEKERAEHLMLVDLARNDLGRVCLPGSVKVEELFGVERYSHVTHIVSNVVGQRNDDATWLDVMKATFPGGTITGCPKIRCIEILNQLEPISRGAYTGSLGYSDLLHGTFDFNILIRTITLLPSHPVRLGEMEEAGTYYTVLIQAGAGIVQDSVAAHEYKESLRKASALFEVVEKLDVYRLDAL